MKYEALKWEIHDNPNRPGEPCIGIITLNRPEHLNAVDVKMRVELDALCDEIRHNSQVKVVIITGEGRGFSAGGDLKSESDPLGAGDDPDFDMGNLGPYKELAHLFFNDLRHQVLQRAFKKFEDLQPITIAAINGPAVGIGLEICTLCDLRIASYKAKLGEVAEFEGYHVTVTRADERSVQELHFRRQVEEESLEGSDSDSGSGERETAAALESKD